MMWNNYNYKNDPLLRHEMTMEELVEKMGRPAVFAGTSVDDVTAAALVDFFLLNRLADYPKRFLWLWRRRLNLYYPIYKEELEMWTARKAFAWFYDNNVTGKKTHDGTQRLDEETAAELLRELARTMNDTLEGKTHSEGNSEGSTENNTQTDASGTDTYNNAGNDKRRQFAFNYPESNYSGGVIPYDLENNPSVEFINTQGDAVGKTGETHNGSDTNESETDATGSHSDNFTQDGTTNNTSENKTSENANENSTGTRAQDITTHWEESDDKRGDNINKLAAELLEQIPATNFWKEFTDKLGVCFQRTYLLDEVIEEEEENGDA